MSPRFIAPLAACAGYTNKSHQICAVNRKEKCYNDDETFSHISYTTIVKAEI